jgi:hypothetical protein
MKEWEHWPSLEIPGSVAGNCHLLSKLTVPARHPDAEAASFWPDRVQRRQARQDTQAIPRSAALVNISPEIAGRLVIRQNPSIVCCRFFSADLSCPRTSESPNALELVGASSGYEIVENLNRKFEWRKPNLTFRLRGVRWTAVRLLSLALLFLASLADSCRSSGY